MTRAQRLLGALMAGMVVLMLSACHARGPVVSESLDLLPSLPSGMARVMIFADQETAGISRAEVFLNGRRLGKVQASGVYVADVLPGVQTVSLGSELGHSTAFRATAGQTHYIRLNGGAGFLIGAITPVEVPPEEGAAAVAPLRLSAWPIR